MELFYEWYCNILISVLLAKYYEVFLTPKGNKRFVAFFAFGGSYLLAHQLVKMLFSGFDAEALLSLFKVAVIAGIVYALSCLFFKKNFGLQVFLLCSFFAVQDICIFITTSLGNISTSAGNLLFNHLWDRGLLSSTEQVTRYFDIAINVYFVLYMLFFTFTIILCLRGIVKNFVYKKYALRPPELLALTLPCLTGLSMTHIMRATFFNPDGSGLKIYNETPAINILILSAAIFLLLTIVASVKLLQRIIGFYIEEKNAAILQKQIKQMQDQDTGGMYAEIKSLKHDMKNHLNNIGLLVKAATDGRADVADDLGAYLGKMNDALAKFDFVYQTGHSISDVVIHQKYWDATGKGINFTSDFFYPAPLHLDAYDLGVILSNALENAIEACKDAPEQARFIRLASHIRGNMFFIEVENSFIGDISLDRHTGFPITTKPDSSMHGIGLSNIRRCAEKYFGAIDFQVTKAEDHSVFCLTVMLEGKG